MKCYGIMPERKLWVKIGIIIFGIYTICGFQFHNIWNWSEINTIHIDSISSKPNVELHIGKDITARRFILSKNDADKALTITSKMNSKIYIAELKKRV